MAPAKAAHITIGLIALLLLSLGLLFLPRNTKHAAILPTIAPTSPPAATAVAAATSTSPPTHTPTATPTSTATATVSPTATPTATTIAQASWPPSLLSGELHTNYPLTTTVNSLIIHYQPDTYPAANIEELTAVLDQISTNLETNLGGGAGHPINLYLAGTLFAQNPALQGLTRSYEFQTAVLVNGAFHPGERNYILAHELTHIIATHQLGPPHTPLLHEGLATYLTQNHLTQTAGYLPHTTICAAALQSGQFPTISQLAQLGYGPTSFGGHIRTFIHYNLSGCFVGYLLETYGLEKLNNVYDSGNYQQIYGRSLADLETDWQATLATTSLPFDPTTFITLNNEIAQAYESYITASANGIHANWPAYLLLNQARLATNQGQLTLASERLAAFWSLFQGTPP